MRTSGYDLWDVISRGTVGSPGFSHHSVKEQLAGGQNQFPWVQRSDVVPRADKLGSHYCGVPKTMIMCFNDLPVY